MGFQSKARLKLSHPREQITSDHGTVLFQIPKPAPLADMFSPQVWECIPIFLLQLFACTSNKGRSGLILLLSYYSEIMIRTNSNRPAFDCFW